MTRGIERPWSRPLSLAARGTCAALVAVVLAVLFTPAATADDSPRLPELAAGRRVYDETGRSLSAAQAAALQQRLESLRTRVGADVVVLVRELDATPEETFDQVEALQQAWVRATGTDQDTAGAILVNREPGTDDEARAGIFLGSTYDDGNVPRDEQEDIVAETLIPPLRDGDVATSIGETVGRLGRDIRDGPPEAPPSMFATDPAFAVGYAVVVLAGFVFVIVLYRRRPRATRRRPEPTTRRPDGSTPPHVAAALLFNRVSASTVSAFVLIFASRGALVFEPASTRFGRPVVQVRLTGPGAPGDDAEALVWDRLEQAAEDAVVSSRALRRMAAHQRDLHRLVKDELRRTGRLAEHRVRARVLSALVGLLALPVAIVGFATGGLWAGLLTLVLAPVAVFVAADYPVLSAAAQDEGRSWHAYREGLKAATDEQLRALGLAEVVPFMTALGLLQQALDVVGVDTGLSTVAPLSSKGAASVSGLTVFQHTFTPPSGSGGSFSGGGAGGGGGAAGST